MSRIQTVTSYQQPNMKQSSQNYSQSASFKGNAYESLKPEAKEILAQARPKMGAFKNWVSKKSQYLSDTQGEVQNNIINAFFTTTFAPIFIAFNPFAHEDKKTKEYTALRQPVSAAVALGCVLPINDSFNKYLGRQASNGAFHAYDLRMNPETDYLKGLFNKAKKGKTGTELNNFLKGLNPELDVDVKAPTGSEKPSKAYLKACKEAFIKAKQNERKAIFTTLISENPKNLKIENGVITRKSDGTEVGRGIPNLNTEPELTKYLDENNIHNVKLSKFLKDEFNFEFYEDGSFKPYTLNKKLSEIKAKDFLEQLGFAERDKIDSTELRTALQSIRQEKPENVRALQDAIPGAKAEAFKVIGKDTTRNIQMASGEELGKADSASLGHFFHQLDYRVKNGKLQELSDMKLSEVFDILKTNFKGKISGIDGKTVLKDFGKNIINNKANKVQSHFGTFKKYAGLALNLPVTVLSCTILNWAYPRFVELAFPSLVKDDAPKGGNK